MWPGFLIVGAQRCGTTSMYHALSEHPAALPSLRREVHYFDVAYKRKLGWYQSHFPLRVTARRRQQETGLPPVTFESSPYYMFHPLAPARIARDLPGVRLLVLVRDPVARAYSAHAHEVVWGHESEPFERALELEDVRLAGEVERMISDPAYVSVSHRHHAYQARGRYVEQLDRLAATVGRSSIHVIDSGDFFSDPEPIYDRVLEFLGLPHRGYPDFRRHNARAAPPLPDSLRSELSARFHSYDARLTEWLGREPSWRR
jgi:hypothetical protein